MMEGKRLLQSIRIQNLLSFGTEGVQLDLQPLNVLIGPNASGKSNLLDALSLLQAAPRDLRQPTRQDGVEAWLWKGAREVRPAELQAIVCRSDHPGGLDYRLTFGVAAQRFELLEESISETPGASGEVYYRFHGGRAEVTAVTEKTPGRIVRSKRELAPDSLKPGQSVLSQLREPFIYPELTYLARCFGEMRLYREAGLGREAANRLPQRTDAPGGWLEEDSSNLAVVVSELQSDTAAYDAILQRLQDLYPRVEAVYSGLSGNRLQVFVRERGIRQAIPATRLSDGTIRFLCLLVVLCHPNPPPFVAIEEPELGMHPDIIQVIAELLVEASRRTQLLVTTHSDLLISQFTEQPEVVVVCDQGPDGTYLRRLGPGLLGEGNLSLGEQWLKGQIGGTRW